MNEYENTANTEEEVRRLLERAGPRAAVPADDVAAIKAAARNEWLAMVDRVARDAPARRPGGPSRTVLALAAMLLLAVAAAWWGLARLTPPSPAVFVASVELLSGKVDATSSVGGVELGIGAMLPVGTVLETGGTLEDGGRLAFRLSNGHSVRLDVGTKARLIAANRLRLERGGVYLDSGSEPLASEGVEVETRFGTIHEVGTQFEVRLDQDRGLSVRVREGEIRLETDSRSYSAFEGEELRRAADGTLARDRIDLHGSAWNWAVTSAPALEIEGVGLDVFLDWVTRETGWRVVFEDEDLAVDAGGIVLHGSIEGLTPQQSVAVVLPGSGLDHRVSDGVLSIARP